MHCSATVQSVSCTVYIGCFHELPDGSIALTYRATQETVRYSKDDDNYYPPISHAEYATWKLRRDLKDYPNARDPRLPYSFDLLWDMKYLSELRRVLHGESLGWLSVDRDDIAEIRQCAHEHGLLNNL